MTSPPDLYTRWTELADDELTVDNVGQVLGTIPDDLWVAAACVDRLVDDLQLERTLLQTGLTRTQPVLERVKNLIPELSASSASSSDNGCEKNTSTDSLSEYFKELPVDAKLCHLRAILLGRLDRLNTFVEICKEAPDITDGEENADDAEWEDDPWAESNAEVTRRTPSLPPFSLSRFLVNDLFQSAYLLALHQWFAGLRVLLDRHGPYLWPFRFAILEHIPAYANPTDYRQLLPSCNIQTNTEELLAWNEWRPERDTSEVAEVQSAVRASGALSGLDVLLDSPHSDTALCHELLTSEQVSSWYQTRVEEIIASTGMIDNVLTIVQHGASQGVPQLDALGEELSLLSRLVYDASRDQEDHEDWTLARWRVMDPTAVVRAYLAHSTPHSLPHDISHFVMPYLFVLESRAERAGNPDPSILTRLLYDYILEAPLDMVAAIFEASKPTLPTPQRIIKKDDDMVRLALACLYGNTYLNEWPTMSRVFECLPVWDLTSEDSEEDATETTISSLGSFVAPSTTRPVVTPSDLLTFFVPLPLSSLSRALDILDVHLESGEILARWSVPAPLRWFLQSSNDAAEQRAWANRMARRAGGSDDQLNTQEDWEWLLEDMLKLSGKGDGKLKSAFGLLSQDEVLRIYFSGLLSTGKFDIARTLLHSPKRRSLFETVTIEDICLSCSREFYDNASSGNYKFGDMKLAYECLDVPPLSDRLLKEKEFIEATSRLSSFNVMSRPGVPISPIEIRLTKDRLSLVSRVLSSNSDAYRHVEVILDLVYKLGFRDDAVAEVKALAMLADTALQAEDFARAYETSLRMVNTVLNLRSAAMGLDDPKVREASEVCWVACFQLGRQTEFEDTPRKLSLLGRAIEICPPDRIHDVLIAWRKLEKVDVDAREERLIRRRSGLVEHGHQKRTKSLPESAASSLQARLQGFHMPSPPLLTTPDAKALASKTFKTVTASFPFSVGHRGRSQLSYQDEERSRSGSRRRADGEDVQTQASRVFSKGIGWLIGTDEDA